VAFNQAIFIKQSNSKRMLDKSHRYCFLVNLGRTELLLASSSIKSIHSEEANYPRLNSLIWRRWQKDFANQDYGNSF